MTRLKNFTMHVNIPKMPFSLRQQQICSGELAIDDKMQNRNTLIATEAKTPLGG